LILVWGVIIFGTPKAYAVSTSIAFVCNILMTSSFTDPSTESQYLQITLNSDADCNGNDYYVTMGPDSNSPYTYNFSQKAVMVWSENLLNAMIHEKMVEVVTDYALTPQTTQRLRAIAIIQTSAHHKSR